MSWIKAAFLTGVLSSLLMNVTPETMAADGDRRGGRGSHEEAMIDKTAPSAAAAIAGIGDGATVMIGGFGLAGMPSADRKSTRLNSSHPSLSRMPSSA